MEIGARLFAERGYHQVTVDELGAALGVSGPALYHHFPSKEALLNEVLVSISERVLTGGHKTVDAAANAALALRGLIRDHVRFALHETPLIVVHVRDLIRAPQTRSVGSGCCRVATSNCGPCSASTL